MHGRSSGIPGQYGKSSSETVSLEESAVEWDVNK